MLLKKIKFYLIIILFYQTPVYSKSTSFVNLKSKTISKYFSGIVAYQNEENSKALDFLNSSKILINDHNPYLKRYVYTLVLENKVAQAINILKSNKERENSNFFDANLLLILDSLKKNQWNKAYAYTLKNNNFAAKDRLNEAILESLKQYIYVFKHKQILENKKNLGNLSTISEAFQKCFLGDKNTDSYFSNLINDSKADYTRYTFFYLSYLVENNRIDDALRITKDINYLNSTLLLSQGKNWVENKNIDKFTNLFSCKNSNDLIGEFLFLIANLYSSQENYEKSNFYLNLSVFFNPKFSFNLSLSASNYFVKKDYQQVKKILKNFKKNDNFYYWYRVKQEAQIISKQRNKTESLNYILAEFNKIKDPNDRILFDIANFYKNANEYKEAIKYYSKILVSMDNNSAFKSDLLYRRGGCYERIGDYNKADKDLLDALTRNPDDAYILNYLAYSWLERNYKIDKAIEMLKKAYSLKKNDPYIIDSIGWAYYLINDHLKAEKFLKRAVEIMPDDPIVNDHYGDILWKLGRKIQARYFWANVLKMETVEQDMIININNKIINGLKKS